MESQNWPDGMPKTYTELFNQYGTFISRYLIRHNKVDRNREDLTQEVFTKLMESKILEKFAKSVQTRNATLVASTPSLPDVLTTDEACAYLNVKWSNWKWHQWRFVKKLDPVPVWMPEPVQGTRQSQRAQYTAADVLDLEILSKNVESKVFIRREVPVRQMVVQIKPLSPNAFKFYLTRAVHNHFANWCRTRSRRYKELVLPPMEDGSAWESRLEQAMSLDDASVIDMATHFRSAHVDLDTDRGVQILDMVAEGYSLTDAVSKYDSAQAKIKAIVEKEKISPPIAMGA